MRKKALQQAQANQQVYLQGLFDLLRIPSISTLPEHKDNVQQAAEWLALELTRIGLNNAQVFPTGGHPVVYADWLNARSDAYTLLIYGHYDVQPVDPLDLWESSPFEPEIREGWIFARGASDDKGQAFSHIKAVESILSATGSLPINVKFILEGEEEIGSRNLDAFIRDHRELLKADSAVISDSHLLSPTQPLIIYGLRGLTYMEVKVSGPAHDLHSGSYGGTVHNPAQALAEMLSKLHNDNGTVLIPGFYDRVQSISPEEREALSKVPFTLEMWQTETGLQLPWGEKEFTLSERRGARPTCEINGIWGGFQGQGGKTIIPAQAGAKVSMRLVPDQNPLEIADLFTAYMMQVAPPSLNVEVNIINSGSPAITPLDRPEIEAAASAYEMVWGVGPVYSREGGSIPVVATFQEELGIPVVLMGFGLAQDQVHAPNERYRVDHFHKGIEALIHYYYNVSEIDRVG